MFSVTPMAARWRVPSCLEMEFSSVRGRKQPAATMRVPRMTVAPSCRGVLGSKMFSSSGAETMESMGLPVSMMSPRAVLCLDDDQHADLALGEVLHAAG